MSTPKQVKHWFGTRRDYSSLNNIDEGTLYFISDESVVYRGSQLYGYTGPFAVQAISKNGNDLTVTIESGAVVVGEKRYLVNEVTSLFAQTLSSGHDLYLVGSYNADSSSASFQYSAISSESIPSNVNTFYTRIAGNRGGVMRQFQFGEIVTVPWGISGSGVTEEEVDSSISSALDDFASRYGLTPVPVIKYDAPTISADVTSLTNSNVILTASYVEQVTSKQYSSNGTSWLTYPVGGVTVSANGTRYFRGADANGDLTSTGSYSVTNIDKTAPNITLSGYNNTTQTLSTSITASTETGLAIYWRKGDSGNWTEYAGPVSVTENGTWNFKATDAAGNTGTKSVSFSNIGGDVTPPVITLTYNNTTPNLQSDTLTATTNETATIEYNTASASATSWTEYTGPIEVYENGTYYFRATDPSGNVGTASVTYDNLVRGHETDPGHEDEEA